MKAYFNAQEHLVVIAETVAEDMALELFCSRGLSPLIMRLEKDSQ